MPYINVRGGTNAGWRRTIPAGKPWYCGCLVKRPAYLLNCTDCKEHQPNK